MSGLENIKSATLRMKVSRFKDGLHLRMNTDMHPKADELIRMEAISREHAYRNTRIRTSTAFYDDSDMKSEYYLVLVYDALKNIPLLTARYYFDSDVIQRAVKGGKHSDSLNLSQDFFRRSVFLADRLSANVASTNYRQFRTYVHSLFYQEIFRRTENSSYMIMARKEEGDKLLKKYLALGTEILGTLMHKGWEHWLLFGDVNKSYSIVTSLNEKQQVS